jgi:hypothetical protein
MLVDKVYFCPIGLQQFSRFTPALSGFFKPHTRR